MGTSSISGPFSMAMLNNQRVYNPIEESRTKNEGKAPVWRPNLEAIPKLLRFHGESYPLVICQFITIEHGIEHSLEIILGEL